MSNSPGNAGFHCTVCGKYHAFTPYVAAHRFEHLVHRCECGARHGIYDGDVDLIPTTEAAPTEWFPPTVEPVHVGFLHIKFPNGTEADRNWYWDGATFRYDKDSPISIALNAIGGWRGLNRRAS